MNSCLRNWLLCGVVLALTGRLAADEVSPPSREAIAAALLARDEALEAVALECIQVPRDVAGKPAGRQLHRRVAARRPGYFLRDNGHAHAQMELADDLARKSLLVRPEGAVQFTHLNRLFEEDTLRTDERAAFDLEAELLFHSLCWWPFENWTPPEVFGHKWRWRELLETVNYTVRPTADTVDGRVCWVFEAPGVDVVWVDAVHWNCVVRRETYNTTTGALTSRFEFADHEEDAPNVWIPRKMHSEQFDSYARSEALRSYRVVNANFRIANVLVNDQVTDAIFRIDFPPGTMRRKIIDSAEILESVRDGQDDHLRAVVDWAHRAVPNGGDGSSGSIPSYVLALTVGFVLSWVASSAGCFAWRRPH